MLRNQKHPIVIGIMLAYTSSNDLYSELNRALRDKIVTYSDTMGPYAYILYQVIKYGSKFREVDVNRGIEHFNKNNVKKLYRGSSLHQKFI